MALNFGPEHTKQVPTGRRGGRAKTVAIALAECKSDGNTEFTVIMETADNKYRLCAVCTRCHERNEISTLVKFK